MILVTGASGLLGSNLTLAARDRGLAAVGVHHLHGVRLAGVRNIAADLTDSQAVSDLFRSLRPRWIVHCAAMTNVDQCEDDPDRAWRINVDMTQGLAAATRACDGHFVYISTDAVFDGSVGGYSEEDAPAPVNHYGRSKLGGEMAARTAFPETLVIRTNLFGWNIRKKASLAEWVLSRLTVRQQVPAFEDVVFSPLLVNDLSEIVLDLLKRCATGVYHAGAADSMSKYKFALEVARAFGLDFVLVQKTLLNSAGLRAQRPRNTSLRTEKLHRELGRPLPTVAEGIARFRHLRESGFVEQLKQMEGTGDHAAH